MDLTRDGGRGAQSELVLANDADRDPLDAHAVSGKYHRFHAGIGRLQPEARTYHPHLTVARCSRPWPRRAAEAWVEAFPSLVGEPFEVGAGHLIRSRLGRGGATYEIVGSYPLERGP